MGPGVDRSTPRPSVLRNVASGQRATFMLMAALRCTPAPWSAATSNTTFGKKTFVLPADLAAFLAKLRHLSESDESQVDHGPR